MVPTLRRYKGIKNWSTPVLNCVMDCDLSKRNAFDRYVQGKVIFGDGQPRFVANRHFNSSSMLGLYTVNALALSLIHISRRRSGWKRCMI